MPELPDLTVYIEHLDRRVIGETLQDIRLASPFVLRTVLLKETWPKRIEDLEGI